MKIRFTSFTFLFLFMSGCAVRQAAPTRSEPRLTPTPVDSGPAASPSVYQSGVASWYGEGFDGKPPADGEVYDMNRLTAAHQTLPFHTFVEVENPANGRKVVVRINDRGPFLKNRVIDLSRKAAERLGMVETGTAMVNLRLLPSAATAGAPEPAGGTPDEPSPSSLPGVFCLQVGAFGERANAEARLREVQSLLPGRPFRIVTEEGLYKVVSENLPDADSARELQRQLDDQGVSGFLRSSAGS